MTGDAVLLVRAGGRACVVPLDQAREILRPLPLEDAPDAPPALLGVAVLRGEPAPVLSLAALIGAPAGPARRWVSLAAEGRRAALAVDEVIGVRRIAPERLARWPTPHAAIGALGAWEGSLAVVVRPLRELPDSYWEPRA